ncbi:MAG: toxin-antitoxin system YwqK family antitoxin [Agriterribacter sp.]
MRYFVFLLLLLASFQSQAQWKSFIISVKGDTLNRLDQQDQKQGPWVIRVEDLRGEPGYEEEGFFEDNKKTGMWRKYALSGDLIAIENYKWGEKDGKQQYYTKMGDLLREESWRATNPENPYDSVQVPDPVVPNKWEMKIVKLEVASVAHGTWKFYDPSTGFITKQETYVFGQKDKNSFENKTAASAEKPAAEKPKEVTDWEKQNSGKKKVKVRDGRTAF